MPIQILKATSPTDFQDLTALQFLSFENPPTALRTLFYPTTTTGPDARNIAISQARNRILRNHEKTEGSCWIKAVDMETGGIVGGALWIFFEENPYEEEGEGEGEGSRGLRCDWWPEGEGRAFTEVWYGMFRRERVRFMRRRHAYLNLCFVHPDFRRQGIGSQLLEWGIKRVDEKNMVAYIDAAALGKGLYESFGFVAMPEVVVNFEKENPGEVWKRLEEECLPFFFWPMIREVKKGVDDT